MNIPNAVSIAGSDPSGGAGIQADLKTFSALKTYGMSVLTALTAQSTQGVTGVVALDPEFVVQQLETLHADVAIHAIKIGMVANAGIALAVAAVLKREEWTAPIVLDPVMVAKGGAPLLAPDAAAAVRHQLVPIATVVTPNLPEAAALLNTTEATCREEMEEQAQQLLALGPQAVMLKGGHLPGEESPDLWLTSEGSQWLEGPRIPTTNTHGTGCTLSSALAALLARGILLPEVAAQAKAYVTEAIQQSNQLTVGTGHGPVHHFHALWGNEESK